MWRKTLDDEMLTSRAPRAEPDKSDRVATPSTTSAVPTPTTVPDPKALAAELAATTDPEKRRVLLARIQERLGNQDAERIVRSVRQAEEK